MVPSPRIFLHVLNIRVGKSTEQGRGGAGSGGAGGFGAGVGCTGLGVGVVGPGAGVGHNTVPCPHGYPGRGDEHVPSTRLLHLPEVPPTQPVHDPAGAGVALFTQPPLISLQTVFNNLSKSSPLIVFIIG